MKEIEPSVCFQGMLIDRSGGRYGLNAPSSKELMETVPEWPAFIKSITSWTRVEAGTFTLDSVTPVPPSVLQDVVCLGTEPNDLFESYDPNYAQFLREKRGPRRFYGAIALSGNLVGPP